MSREGRFLSLVLRHRPELLGLRLGPGGWAGVEALLAGLAQAGRPLTPKGLERIVAEDAKRRFTLSPDGARIRAAQGHSVPVELGLSSVAPPEVLFHGTAEGRVAAILRDGLKPGRRRHVHLSPDPMTAREVGRRHGSPVVLEVAAGAMHRDGHAFQQADNGVWLTDAVPAQYLEAAARWRVEARPSVGGSIRR